MTTNPQLDVVCTLKCPGCHCPAIGVTEASAQREVEAYRTSLANLLLEAQREAIHQRRPTMFAYRYCAHCQTPSMYFKAVPIHSEDMREAAQRVVAPAITWQIAEAL